MSFLHEPMEMLYHGMQMSFLHEPMEMLYHGMQDT